MEHHTSRSKGRKKAETKSWGDGYWHTLCIEKSKAAELLVLSDDIGILSLEAVEVILGVLAVRELRTPKVRDVSIQKKDGK
jgi:hypothetical protein